MEADDRYQKWMREISRYLPIKKLFFISGNIYDKIPYPSDTADIFEYTGLREVMKKFFDRCGYKTIGFYDMVDGLTTRVIDEAGNVQQAVKKAEIMAALETMRGMLANDSPTAVVIDFSSRLLQRPEELTAEESRTFLTILKCAQGAKAVRLREYPGNNALFLVCDKINDMPVWLYLNNPIAKAVVIEKPDTKERERFIAKNFRAFKGSSDVTDGEIQSKIEQMADLADGLCIVELQNMTTVSHREEISVADAKGVKSIIDQYKYGTIESQWQKDLLATKLRNAEEKIRSRVKGQPRAIHAVLDIVKRAGMGLSGVQHSSSSSKPRGVLFFAGPTGVGKTELAKALAETLFGDEKFCLRFDMSEYRQEHADQRLLGAPPGYVGYDAGGQLTDKVREHPFSVVLFDEIEKAHPTILDKFLQILEDGRLTDGKGETVYFSESIIVFTSNIGAIVEVPQSNGTVMRKINIFPTAWSCSACGWLDVSGETIRQCGQCGEVDLKCIETPYEELKKRIMTEIEDHFKLRLGRPELYNRFGNNFIVFDYIRPAVMKEIVDKMLENIIMEVKAKHRIDVRFSQTVKESIYSKASANAEQGGRGVGNLIEAVLVNPLARKLFDEEIKSGTSLLIEELTAEIKDGAEMYSLRTR